MTLRFSTLKTGLTRFVAILLVLAFFFNVREQVTEYRKKFTTTTIWNEKEWLEFPAISFCPGFRRKLIQESRFGLIQWNQEDGIKLERESQGKYPESRAKMEQFWVNVTFPLDRLLVEKNRRIMSLPDNPAKEWRRTVEDILVEQTDTGSGRCYTLRINARRDDLASWEEHTLSMTFDLRSQERSGITVYIHEPYNRNGLHLNQWLSRATAVHIKPGTITYAGMKKRRREYYVDKVVSERSFHECYEKVLRNNMHDHNNHMRWRTKSQQCHNSTLCYSPPLDFLLGPGAKDSMQWCETAKQYICSNIFTTVMLMKSYRDYHSVCQKASHRIAYSLPVLLTDDNGIVEGNKTKIYIYYDVKSVEVHGEMLITDLNAIVSLVGGSLGMFVGVSILGIIKQVLDRIEIVWQGRNKKNNTSNKRVKS